MTKTDIIVTRVDSSTRMRVVSQGTLRDAAAMLVGAYDDMPGEPETTPITLISDGGINTTREPSVYEPMVTPTPAKTTVDVWNMNITDGDQLGRDAFSVTPPSYPASLSGLLHPAGPPTLDDV